MKVIILILLLAFAAIPAHARDPYEALGVPRGTPWDQIQKRYRRIALDNHPDLHPGDAAKEKTFKEAADAFEKLYAAEREGRLYSEGDDKRSKEEIRRDFEARYQGRKMEMVEELNRWLLEGTPLPQVVEIGAKRYFRREGDETSAGNNPLREAMVAFIELHTEEYLATQPPFEEAFEIYREHQGQVWQVQVGRNALSSMERYLRENAPTARDFGRVLDVRQGTLATLDMRAAVLRSDARALEGGAVAPAGTGQRIESSVWLDLYRIRHPETADLGDGDLLITLAGDGVIDPETLVIMSKVFEPRERLRMLAEVALRHPEGADHMARAARRIMSEHGLVNEFAKVGFLGRLGIGSTCRLRLGKIAREQKRRDADEAWVKRAVAKQEAKRKAK